ncbi:stage II sporulation protein M [Paenibacillus aurantius]|uniref:Stage II sporulation protein M n=1 Tax=Paenibacillus aurantius TaxID=2918900 RepID=A0AA96L9V2_9BACL|nr:stage II sporulation protein M [Paenibacillus aurantius]WNQ09363.1 stage II sporulation protein M [Paenibacillus aurantius]
MKEHLSLYVFIGVIFVTGVVFGAILVNALTLDQTQELRRHLGSFFQVVDQGTSWDQAHSFWQSFSMNVKWVLLIWLLGLSVVGLPLIFILDFLKGVLVGFTVGYLAGQYAWKGVLFSLVSVAPQNLIHIPVIVICSVAGMSFSLYLIKNRFIQKRGNLYAPFMNYLILSFSMVLVTGAVSLYEAFLSPELMRWVTPMLVTAGG